MDPQLIQIRKIRVSRVNRVKGRVIVRDTDKVTK